jgi:hypothetical protein
VHAHACWHHVDEPCASLQVLYKGEGRHSADVGAIQAHRPCPNNVDIYYFELTVLESGEAGRVAIGFSQRDFKLIKQPG